MPLKTLSELDGRTADAVLASAVLFLSNPVLNPLPEPYKITIDKLMDEADQKVSSAAKIGSDRQDLVMSFLSSEVSRRLLSAVEEKSIGERLGIEGRLPLGAYRVLISQAFANHFKRESAKFAISSIHQNDGFEHLYADDMSVKKDQFSVFRKVVVNKKTRKQQWAIFTALREAEEIRIAGMYRLFPETVPVRGDPSPLELFRAFLEIYGENLIIDGVLIKDRLIRDLPLKSGLSRPDWTVRQETAHEAYRAVWLAGFPLKPRIAICYGINLDKYWADHTRFA